MATVDNNPICKCKKRNSQIVLKRNENKQKLINEILNMISSDMYSYEGLCLSLAKEALQTRT